MTFIKPFKAIKPILEEINSPEAFFGEVKKNFSQYKKAGLLKKTKRKSVFIYEIKREGTVHRGLVCAIPLEEYDKGLVVKHEQTLAAKEQKTLSLALHRKALIKPVLLTYPKIGEIEAAIQKVFTNTSVSHQIYFENYKELHTFHEVNDEKDIEALQAVFQEYVPKTYIADGHHRLATSSILKRRIKSGENSINGYDDILCALFPTNELEIHDYNRIVELKEISPMKLMAKLTKKFEIKILEKPRKSEGKHEIVMTDGSDWYALKWKSKVLKNCSSSIDFLDVNLLNTEILKDIFRVENVAEDKTVSYVEGPKGLNGVVEKLKNRTNTVAFLLPPISWEDFIDITNAGVMLPPKSTWFEPRIKNGLIVYGY